MLGQELSQDACCEVHVHVFSGGGRRQALQAASGAITIVSALRVFGFPTAVQADTLAVPSIPHMIEDKNAFGSSLGGLAVIAPRCSSARRVGWFH